MKTVRLFVTTILVLLSCSSVFAQNFELKGVVTDAETGEPIPFASVLLKGTKIGVACDEEGVYSIVVPVGKDNIVIYSSIGYQRKEIPVGKEFVQNVALETDVNALQETMVVAFGTSTKESFTGSATVVKSSDIAKTQSSDATRALEGVVAGVQMTTSSGTPGASPSIRIRGISSISASSAPLYIVDGVPFSGDMNNINPADIESMTVLKDAASNALYGARGANGVIMITTKKAKTHDAVVNFDMKLGWNSKALREYDYVRDPALYYEMHYGALKNYHMTQGLSAAEAHSIAAKQVISASGEGGLAYNVYTYPDGETLIGSNGKLNPNATLGRVVTDKDGNQFTLLPDDWMDLAYRNSLRQEYNLSVSGRTSKSSFYASFGYLYNKGIIKFSNQARYTARLKADYQAKKWLKVGANAAYAHFSYGNSNGDEGSKGSTGNIFAFASSIAPIYPMYMRDGQGNIMHDKYGNKRYDFGKKQNAGLVRPIMPDSNPFQLLELDRSRSEGNAFNGTAFAEVTFLKDFKFTFNVGIGLEETRSTNMNNKLYGQFASVGGTLSKSHSRTMDYNLQQLLSYDKTFGKHHINALLGHENYMLQTWGLSAFKKKLVSMDNLELGGAVIDGKNAGSSYGDYNNEGYFLRAQYDYNGKIFASASYRRDASSKFHPDHRWGNFWSLGAGWLINHEPWFNASWVEMLKLKASIGSQGNDNISNFLYTDLYEISNSNDEPAIGFGSKGNENITWETNTNFNIGVDFDLFKGKINGTFEYFNRKTTDMLFFFNLPISLGYSGYYDNVGDMRNSGVELSLNFNPIRTKDVNWNIYMNLTHYKNKVTMLPDEKKTINVEGYEGYASGTSFLGEGLPLNTFYMPKSAGVDQETGLPLWYKDVKDDAGNVTGREVTTEYSEATDYLCGNPTPKIYGGFGTSVDFFGFDLALQFTYQVGGLVYDGGYASLMTSPTPSGQLGGNYHKDLLKAWTPEHHSTTIPRFVYKDLNVSSLSDRFLTDASYLNFQNIQFGYTLPRNLTRKIKVEKVRIYLSCDNVCYFSQRRGLDPRYSFSGSTNDSVNSPVRTLSGGLSFTF